MNAAERLRLRDVTADVIHLDAGHEEASVAADLRAWWPIRRQGGLLIADDDDRRGGRFPGVTRAVDAFCTEAKRGDRGRCGASARSSSRIGAG